jgi:hypothetical protein
MAQNFDKGLAAAEAGDYATASAQAIFDPVNIPCHCPNPPT